MRTTRDVLLTVALGTLLYGSVLAVIQSASTRHWLVGTVVTIVYAFAVCLGILDLRSEQGRRVPIHKGLAISLLTILTGVAVAASVSFQLLRAGWAVYEPTPSGDYAYLTLNAYYFWVFLDMLPGLKATELLAFNAPLKPTNSAAGIPVLLFRAFVLFGFLAAIKAWWGRRRQLGTTASTPIPGSES
jgi:hypothetical protein